MLSVHAIRLVGITRFTHSHGERNMDTIETLYLDWFNNFCGRTVDQFAEHHGMSFELASLVIEEGRAYNHLRPEEHSLRN